jgi:hypothetical protein
MITTEDCMLSMFTANLLYAIYLSAHAIYLSAHFAPPTPDLSGAEAPVITREDGMLSLFYCYHILLCLPYRSLLSAPLSLALALYHTAALLSLVVCPAPWDSRSELARVESKPAGSSHCSSVM